MLCGSLPFLSVPLKPVKEAYNLFICCHRSVFAAAFQNRCLQLRGILTRSEDPSLGWCAGLQFTSSQEVYKDKHALILLLERSLPTNTDIENLSMSSLAVMWFKYKNPSRMKIKQAT